ncbi:MAG: SusD/RagB family nutrient-binding outer membrane lipoprotein [Mucilaginibacter sp.]
MKKILIMLLAAMALSSCVKKNEYLNNDTKSATAIPASALFSYAEKQLSDVLATSAYNVNIFRLTSQQWTQTTAISESDYDLKLRNVPDGFWNAIYINVLRNLYEANKLTLADATLSAIQKNNRLAQINILEVYAYSVLVNTFGNIPYTQAVDYTNTTPKYDDASQIYDSLLTRLDDALSKLNTSGAGFNTADLLFNGVEEIGSWKKFGNTVKLKLGITLADVEPAKAKTAIEAAAANALQSNADNVSFKYLSTTPNTNPLWVDQVQGHLIDFVAGATLVDLLNSLNDPRRPAYYTAIDTNANPKPGDALAYKGGVIGAVNTYNKYSTFSSTIAAPDLPSVLADYSEVEFDLAEAVERGYSVGGTAEAHYNNAIRASIGYWGGSENDINAYLANPKVAYATAPGSFKLKIGTQKYIALYNRGYEAWTEIRRLGLVLPLPPNQTSYLNRFTYPITEQNVNQANYSQASAAIGGDNIATKLFWDKN